MQTIERPPPTETPRQRPSWGPVALAVLGVAALPLLLFAILNKWGVLILVLVAMTAGLAMWVWLRGFIVIEVVAFLIHFDGVGAGQIRMGRIVAVVLACIIVYKLVVDRWRPPAVPLRSWLPISTLTVWVVITGIWSHKPSAWILTMMMFGLAIVFFCTTAMLVDSHKAIQQFLRAYWVGGLFGSGAGILALVLGTRSVGFGGDPNYFGLLAASMIPLTVYYRRHASDARMRWIYTFILAFVLAGAAGAGSRSGLIGGSLAIVATMITRPGLTKGKRVKVAGIAMLLAPIAFVAGFVANPNNLSRGLTADRGAGRLDLWNVTVDLIQERPLIGHGLGQTQWIIPDRLLVTPGSQMLNEDREAISSHNTWMDAWGDLGLIGLGNFVLIFVIAVYSLARPRWPYTKELSTTILVMLLPVFSSSMFLPLLNNKLAWAVLGLAAALQVKSADARWSGLAGAKSAEQELKELTRAREERSRRGELVHVSGAANGTAGLARSVQPVADPYRVDEMPDVEFAKWDFRIPAAVVKGAFAAAAVAGILTFVVASSLSATHTATAGVIAPRLDTSVSPEALALDRIHMQGVLTLPVSEPYAAELKRLSGIDDDIRDIQSRMKVVRPEMSALIQFTYRDTDEANAKAVQPYLVTALNNIYEDAREGSEARLQNEARPTRPGEQQYYTGPAFLPMNEQVVLGAEEPKAMWMALMASLAVGLAIIGVALIGGRKPRVMATDDFPARTGLRVATRVGGGRPARTRTTREQLQQLVVASTSGADVSQGQRIVLAPTARDAISRRTAIGIAAALVEQGRRVVLVDAQVDRPFLTLRLGGWNRAGIATTEPVGSRLSPARRHGSAGGEPVEPNLLGVNPLRLPVEARKLVDGRVGQLRFVSGGPLSFDSRRAINVDALNLFDDTVTVVVLAPPAGGSVSVSPLYEWADRVLVLMRTGQTTTVQAENTSATVRMFADESSIVLANA